MNTFFCFFCRREGFLGLYRGMEAKLVQTVMTAALMFLCYEKIAAFIFRVMGINAWPTDNLSRFLPFPVFLMYTCTCHTFNLYILFYTYAVYFFYFRLILLIIYILFVNNKTNCYVLHFSYLYTVYTSMLQWASVEMIYLQFSIWVAKIDSHGQWAWSGYM